MSEGLALRRPQSPSNVYFAFLTQVSMSNKNFGIAFKQEGCGDGPRLSCMNFAGIERAIMIASIGSKHYLVKRFPKNTAKSLKFGTS